MALGQATVTRAAPRRTRSVTPNVENVPVLSIIQAAGWPVWFLILASVLAVALIIERAMSLRRKRVQLWEAGHRANR